MKFPFSPAGYISFIVTCYCLFLGLFLFFILGSSIFFGLFKLALLLQAFPSSSGSSIFFRLFHLLHLLQALPSSSGSSICLLCVGSPQECPVMYHREEKYPSQQPRETLQANTQASSISRTLHVLFLHVSNVATEWFSTSPLHNT